jgi:hypothetical protein
MPQCWILSLPGSEKLWPKRRFPSRTSNCW